MHRTNPINFTTRIGLDWLNITNDNFFQSLKLEKDMKKKQYYGQKTNKTTN